MLNIKKHNPVYAMNDKSEFYDTLASNPRLFAVTIGRTFGSGGRLLGNMLAKKLGIDYYDKELLSDAARKANMSPEFFERRDERFPNYISGSIGFNFGMNPAGWYGSNAISDDSVYRAQSDFIREAAMRGPCVIVGRTADYVLRDHPRLISVFVNAPEDECIRRITSRGDALGVDQARSLARRTNKLRANYYNFYTDKQWGNASTYDICIDSSKLSPVQIVDILSLYVRMRVGDIAESL